MPEKKPPDGFDWRAFTPEDSPQTPMDVWADPVHQRLTTPELAVGDEAYDFSRPVYDFTSGTDVKTGRTLQLSVAAAEKPVALIFGSYT